MTGLQTNVLPTRQAGVLPDHCEKNRTWFSQWFVVITFAMPYCCDIRGDHCEKNVRASPDFSQWSGWCPNSERTWNKRARPPLAGSPRSARWSDSEFPDVWNEPAATSPAYSCLLC